MLSTEAVAVGLAVMKELLMEILAGLFSVSRRRLSSWEREIETGGGGGGKIDEKKKNAG